MPEAPATRQCVSHKLLVGLESHVQLATKSKMFTAAPNLSGAMKTGDVLGYGNLYLTGRVNVADILKDPPVPVLLTGGLTLGLNSSRNLPASLPKFSNTDIGSILGTSGSFVGSLTQMLGATTADDIFIGLNGQAELGIKKLGFECSVPIASSSFAMKTINGVGTVGAHGKLSTDPFGGTILDSIISPPIDLSVAVDAGFDTAGAFSLGFGYSDTTSVAGLGTAHTAYAFTLDNSGFDAAVSAGITLEATVAGFGFGADGNASGTLHLHVIDSILPVSGTSNASIDLFEIDPINGENAIPVADIGFAFDNSGFSFYLDPLGTVTVVWYTCRAFLTQNRHPRTAIQELPCGLIHSMRTAISFSTSTATQLLGDSHRCPE